MKLTPPLAEVIATPVTGAGRVTLIKVLEEARHRQILRQAGAVYQSRHADLRDYLTKIHSQRSQPTGAASTPSH